MLVNRREQSPALLCRRQDRQVLRAVSVGLASDFRLSSWRARPWLGRDEVVLDRRRKLVGWQQPLAQDEIVERQAIEVFPECQFGLLPEFKQF